MLSLFHISDISEIGLYCWCTNHKEKIVSVCGGVCLCGGVCGERVWGCVRVSGVCMCGVCTDVGVGCVCGWVCV